MTPHFATCIYTNLYGSRYNGRVGREHSYMFSLNSILGMGANIVCYTGNNDRQNLQDYLIRTKKHKNLLLYNYELSYSPIHDIVEKIKDVNPKYYTEESWVNRCVEIMYGKFFWMKELLNSIKDDEYLYWIDAGLSHGGILPRKFTSSFIEEKDYPTIIHDMYFKDFQYMHEHLFTPELYESLKIYTGDKILMLGITSMQHGESKDVNTNPYGIYPIGGLFGGKKSTLKPFIDEFIKHINTHFDNNILLKEEVIMESIFIENPNWFKLYTFDTWYHDDWGDQYKDMRCFYKFFEEIRNVSRF